MMKCDMEINDIGKKLVDDFNVESWWRGMDANG